MNKHYEKPSMKMVSLRSNEKVANTCWGNHGPETQRYWDTAGKGYVSFYCGDKSCGLTETSLVVWFYDKKEDDTPQLLDPTNGTDWEKDLYNQVYTKLKNSGGESGNPFFGEENFPDKPDGMS